MPIDLNTGLTMVAWLIKQEPAIEAEIRAIFKKNDPSTTDWENERQAWIAGSYNHLVPDSKLPAA